MANERKNLIVDDICKYIHYNQNQYQNLQHEQSLSQEWTLAVEQVKHLVNAESLISLLKLN